MPSENAKSIILNELRRRLALIASMVVFLILTILISVTVPLLFKRLIDETIPQRDFSEAALCSYSP